MPIFCLYLDEDATLAFLLRPLFICFHTLTLATCMFARYEALVGGGDVLAHKAALKELLTFLGIPAEVR